MISWISSQFLAVITRVGTSKGVFPEGERTPARARSRALQDLISASSVLPTSVRSTAWPAPIPDQQAGCHRPRARRPRGLTFAEVSITMLKTGTATGGTSPPVFAPSPSTSYCPARRHHLEQRTPEADEVLRHGGDQGQGHRRRQISPARHRRPHPDGYVRHRRRRHRGLLPTGTRGRHRDEPHRGHLVDRAAPAIFVRAARRCMRGTEDQQEIDGNPGAAQVGRESAVFRLC